MKKTLLLSISLLALVLLFSSCGDKVQIEPGANVTGSWTTGEYDETNPFSRSINLTFASCENSPCNGDMLDNKVESTFTWSLGGNKEKLHITETLSFLLGSWDVIRLTSNSLTIKNFDTSKPYDELKFTRTE